MKSSDAISLVKYLRTEGASFWADDHGDIHVAPAGLLTPDDRELIRANKPAVVAWLRQYARDMLPDEETLRRWQSEARNTRATHEHQ